MLLADPRDLRDAVPDGGRLLGLDVGTKTIGTALSDTRLVIASPLETIRRGAAGVTMWRRCSRSSTGTASAGW